MKIFKIFLLLLFLCPVFNAQENNIVTGTNLIYNVPAGTLAERFKGAFGGSFYLGKKIDESWTWTGKLEYFKLTSLNSEKLKKTTEYEQGGKVNQAVFGLTNLSMELTCAGLSAEAKYNLFRTDLLETNLSAGFGFYFWEFFRNNYQDSLAVDTTGRGDMMIVSVLDVPSMRQRDWSGALNMGIDFNFTIYEHVLFSTGAGYKLIIGELWPALALDLESVSGFQFIELRSGIVIKL